MILGNCQLLSDYYTHRKFLCYHNIYDFSKTFSIGVRAPPCRAFHMMYAFHVDNSMNFMFSCQLSSGKNISAIIRHILATNFTIYLRTAPSYTDDPFSHALQNIIHTAPKLSQTIRYLTVMPETYITTHKCIISVNNLHLRSTQTLDFTFLKAQANPLQIISSGITFPLIYHCKKLQNLFFS